MFKVGDVVKLKHEVIDRGIKESGWASWYEDMLGGGYAEIVSFTEGTDRCYIKIGEYGIVDISTQEIELVNNRKSITDGITCLKLERVGERVILEINGKLSKETIEKILNLVW